MGFPHKESLRRSRFLGLIARIKDGILEPGRQPSVDLIVPAAANAPACLTVFAHHLAADLISRAGFPASGFEVEGADFASSPVFDLHGPIVVNCRVACDDADDRGGYFFPGVKLFATRSGAEFEKPSAEGIELKGFAVEFRFD